MPQASRLRIDVFDDRLLDLLAAWGVPYSWGAGRATIDNWPEGVPGLAGGVGYDCSGFAQAALVRLGLLPIGAPDRGSAALHDWCKEIPNGDKPRLGDLAFYGPKGKVTHVMVCLGNGVVLGASGGGFGTNGDVATAYVKLERTGYRSDLKAVRRPPTA